MVGKLKERFNYLLDRQIKGEAWMNSATPSDQEKHFESYKKILLQLEVTRQELEKRGIRAKLEKF